MIASLTEEAEAIGWYEQRLSVEPNAQARAIMANAQQEEFKHFGMDLEFLMRQKPKWRVAVQVILFKEGDSHCLHVFIAQLRLKIEVDSSRPGLIVSVPGVGYRLGC